MGTAHRATSVESYSMPETSRTPSPLLWSQCPHRYGGARLPVTFQSPTQIPGSLSGGLGTSDHSGPRPLYTLME